MIDVDLFMIRHHYASHQTLSTVVASGFPDTFCCVERAWADNRKDISCVPTGDYNIEVLPTIGSKKPRDAAYLSSWLVLPRYSNRYPRWGVKNDIANYATQLKGCYALGLTWMRAPEGHIAGVSQSRVANEKFMLLLNRLTSRKHSRLGSSKLVMRIKNI